MRGELHGGHDGQKPQSPRVLTHSPTATVRTQNTAICRRLYVLYKMSSMRSEESSSVTSPDHAPSTTEDRASARFAPICKRDALRVPCTQQLAAMNAAGGPAKKERQKKTAETCRLLYFNREKVTPSLCLRRARSPVLLTCPPCGACQAAGRCPCR